MNLLENISSIMSKETVTLGPNDDLLKADKLFTDRKFHHLPVIDEGKLVGMVSKSDLLFFKRGFNQEPAVEENERLQSRKVGDIMVTRLAKLEPTDRINVALEVFKENLFHALPVVENDRLVGIVTTLDIINALADDKGATSEYK